MALLEGGIGAIAANGLIKGMVTGGLLGGMGIIGCKVVNDHLKRKRFDTVLHQSLKDRFMHLQVVGKSGSGKTTLLKNMWKRDAEAGYNLAWIEVKEEDECHAILGLIPKERMDKVVYVSPYENDVGFNVLHLRDFDSEEEAFLVVDTVVNAFSEHYSDSWGVQTEMCLALGTRAILHMSRILRKQHTLEDVYRLLSSEEYMREVYFKLKDDPKVHFSVVDFCTPKELGQVGYAKVPPTSKNSVQTKLRNFITHPLVRKTVCKLENDVDFDQIVRDGILVCNFWKGGALGKVYATTLASFVASNLQIATFRKKKDERKPTFFYYDEFQDYVNKSFEESLTQFRSYQTGVIMSHQYLTQLSKDVRAAIEGCVSSFIHFRAGNDDCAQVVKRLQLEGQKKDAEKYVLEMPTLVCVTRLMHDGKLQTPQVVSVPFVRGINWDVSREIRNNMTGVKMKVRVGYHEQQRHEDIEQPVMVQENDHSADSGLELPRLEERVPDSPVLHESPRESGTSDLQVILDESPGEEVLPTDEEGSTGMRRVV